MSFLKKLTKIVIPATVGFATGGPAGAFAGGLAGSQQEKAERQYKQQVQIAQNERNKYMSEIFGTSSQLTSLQAPMAGRPVQQGGFGANFGEFLGDVGRNIVSPFANLATAVAPFFGRSVQQQPAVTTTRNIGGQETQGSGSIQAGMGSLVGTGLQAAGKFLRSPVGQIGTGLLTGFGLSLGNGQPSGMRITRKMKSQAKMVLNMTGGNLAAASDILGISEQELIMVLLKRFRNDGPVVTKAALRKTKQTVRRLKNMCDMYDSLRPRATRRSSPIRRASSTTLIKN